jgi:hypothetical protein
MWYNHHRYLSRTKWKPAKSDCGELAGESAVRPNNCRQEHWEGAQKSALRVEQELKGELGPWDDVGWGMILGKVSALRWVLGDD